MFKDPFHIIILDDRDSDAWLLRRAIERIHPDLPVHILSDSRILPAYLESNSPIKALRALPHPSLLILQVDMPHYSGFETLTFIRAQKRFGSMITVMLGGSGDSHERTRFMEAGADAYFVRAYTPEGFDRLAGEIINYCALRNDPAGSQASSKTAA